MRLIVSKMAVASGLYAVAIAATILSLVGLEVFGWFFRNHRKEVEDDEIREGDGVRS